MEPPLLDLSTLQHGQPGISRAIGASLAEAAGVCLSHNGHRPRVSIRVHGDSEFAGLADLTWEPPDERAIRSWGDLEEATEYGAYAVAALLVTALTPFTIIARSSKGTGFDYWLGYQNPSKALDLTPAARLEVSGILRGAEHDLRQRMAVKLEQTAATDTTGLPAVVIVVEFGTPAARMARR